MYAMPCPEVVMLGRRSKRTSLKFCWPAKLVEMVMRQKGESYGVRVSNGCGEDYRLEDGVLGEVYSYKFYTSMSGWYLAPAGSQWSACVENPEAIFGVNHDGLYLYEIFLEVGSGCKDS